MLKRRMSLVILSLAGLLLTLERTAVSYSTPELTPHQPSNTWHGTYQAPPEPTELRDGGSPDGLETNRSQQAANEPGMVKDRHDLYAEYSDQFPGFGGLYVDSANNSIVYVYMEDVSQRDRAEQVARLILGPDEPISEVRVVRAKYTFAQLNAWRHELRSEPIPGLTFFGISQADNKLVFGVYSDEGEANARRVVAEHGIPPEAVKIERVGRGELQSHDVQDDFDLVVGDVQTETRRVGRGKLQSHDVQHDFRPVVGGVQTQTHFALGNETCTSGPIVDDPGYGRALVTAAHCTIFWKQVDGYPYYQPLYSQFVQSIGTEVRDPPFQDNSTNPYCPVGYKCRWSDSAVVDLSASGDRGMIARTVLGSTEINTDSPRYRVVSTALPLAGQIVERVGSQTGLSESVVTHDCMDYDVVQQETTYRFLCSHRADTYAGLNPVKGDSGAPVFRVRNSPAPGDVHISGIHFAGETGAPSISFFSHEGNIETDLGIPITWCATGFSC